MFKYLKPIKLAINLQLVKLINFGSQWYIWP